MHVLEWHMHISESSRQMATIFIAVVTMQELNNHRNINCYTGPQN